VTKKSVLVLVAVSTAWFADVGATAQSRDEFVPPHRRGRLRADLRGVREVPASRAATRLVLRHALQDETEISTDSTTVTLRAPDPRPTSTWARHTRTAAFHLALRHPTNPGPTGTPAAAPRAVTGPKPRALSPRPASWPPDRHRGRASSAELSGRSRRASRMQRPQHRGSVRRDPGPDQVRVTPLPDAGDLPPGPKPWRCDAVSARSGPSTWNGH